MVSDVYTKVVLTVIALCLLWLSIGGPSRFEAVKAADGPEHVIIDGWTAQTPSRKPTLFVFSERGGTGLPVSSR